MIRVRISPAEIGLIPSDVYLGSLMLNKLRKAGVPVTGSVFPTGVERGALTQFKCPDTNATVFEWRHEC